MFRIGTASEDPATRLPLHNGGIRFDERAVLAGAVTFGRLAAEYLRYRRIFKIIYLDKPSRPPYNVAYSR